ncbi:MAG: hypothetical protein IJH88_01665 [Eggerthellaceae bacterium]|nr:hypothetical protein [Eggerthellaceae bacterium]
MKGEGSGYPRESPSASIARTERTGKKAEGQQGLTVHMCAISVTAFSTNERFVPLGFDACPTRGFDGC